MKLGSKCIDQTVRKMDNTLEVTILKEGYEVQKKALEINLIGKARFIKKTLESPDMTEFKMKRINAEEDHIKLVIGFSETSGHVIEALENQVHELRLKLAAQNVKVDFLISEANNYQNKFHNEVLSNFAK